VLSVFNTLEVAPHERFSYWAEGICQTFLHVDCRRQEQHPLSGELVRARLAEFEFVDTRSPTMEYHRGPRELAKITGDGVYLLILNLSGCGFLQQHGKQARILPGDVMLYSAIAPSVMAHQQPSRTLAVKIPCPSLRERLSCAPDALSIALSGGEALGALLGHLIREVHALACLGGDDAGHEQFTSGMLDIVSFAFNPNRTRWPGRGGRHPLERIKRYMCEHLDDPQLCQREIANHCGISTRTLHRLFAAEGTSANRWLWMKRLDTSRRLISSGQVRQVSEAAMRCGFNDLSHFCKLFKATYGTTPSQCLQLAVRGHL